MKHAFLVLAHNNYPLIERLLKTLDHQDNTIYIHIDAKSPFTSDDAKRFIESCKLSKVVFTDRYRVNWGGYSQINNQLRILEQAVKDGHDYYHYLSGVDFPTKSMAYIHEFFESNKGKEFFDFTTDEFNEKQVNRYSIYHLLQEKRGRGTNIYTVTEKGLLLLQKIFRVDRRKKYKHIEFKCGSNWASITHGFAEHLLSREEEIKKIFSYSFCCDELFMHTILWKSPFRENIFEPQDNISGNLRTIDWLRGDILLGAPYTFNIDDYDSLIASGDLFCRKVTDATPEGNALIKKLEEL